jgi:hypothetical protein
MGHPVDETRDRDAQPIGDEEPTHDERADEANVREGEEPAEAAALEGDDDEYEMVDPSEFVDVPKEEALEADDAVTTQVPDVAPIEVAAEASAPDVDLRETESSIQIELDLNETVPLRRPSLDTLPPPVKVAMAALSTTSVSIPPPPRVSSRTMPPPPPPRSQAFERGHVPPPPPLRRTNISLPPPPRATISSAPPLTMSETVPPIPRPSMDRSGDRERASWTKRATVAAAIAAALAAAFFGAKRGGAPTSAPPREVAAAIPAAAIPTPEPRAQPEAVAADTVAAAAVPAPDTAEPTPSPSPAATEHTVHPSKAAKESPPADNQKNVQPSASDRAELAAIALQVGATKAAACTMNFNTIPPSRISLDGRDLGMTPKLGVSVPPGTHVVTFANAGGKKVTSAPCKPGEQKTVSMRLPI